jgi:leucyl aminopeptidase
MISMTISHSFSKTPGKTGQGVVVALTDEHKTLPSAIAELDHAASGWISGTLAKSAFKGKAKDIFSLALPEKTGFDHLLLISVGDGSGVDGVFAESCGAKIYKALTSLKAKHVTIFVETETPAAGEVAAHMAQGMDLADYRFDKYREIQDEDKPNDVSVNFVLPDADRGQSLHDRLTTVSQGVIFARDLVNEAPNVLYPDHYAELIKKELTPLGVKVEILDDKKMEKLGMGAILAVGMGSARPPRMVIMHWNGADKKDEKPLGFVGKGVTFDTGGISLKPGASMDEMKTDMGGSAAVVGLMKSLALQKINKNVVGIVGLAENMPSDRAYRPGDIVKSYKGKHIEVLNTDAEGRLVLVDCLTYIQEKFDPVSIVDLATLTGAIMVALGYEYTGAFVNDDTLWAGLEASAKATGEKAWRMPLDETYRKDVESDIASVRNLAKTERWGGACTAAAFLQHFIDEGRIWAHLDIAGTSLVKADTDLCCKGGTGVGVRLLENYVHNLR